MPRKMLDSGQHAVLVRALDVGGYHISDELGILAERTRVDDGVGWVRVDVGIGKPVPVNADGARLLRSNASGLSRKFHVPGGAKRHRMWKIGSFVEAKGEPALEISSENQWKLGVLLQLVGDHGGFERLVLVKQALFELDGQPETANVILVHGVADLDVFRAVHVHEPRLRPDNEHLPYLLLQRHLLQRLASPLLAFLVEMHRGGRLETVAGLSKRGHSG